MEKSIKAALLSALVIPGAGHILLKKYVTATALIATSCIALYILISKAIEKALVITDKILAGAVPMDVATISKLITEQSSSADASSMTNATIALAIAWVIGVGDSYRIGKRQGSTPKNTRQ